MCSKKKIGIVLSKLETSNRGRANYILGFQNDKYIFEKYKDNVDYDYCIVLDRNFIPKKNKAKYLLDFSDAFTIPPKHFSVIKKIYHKYILNRRFRKYFSLYDSIVVASDEQLIETKKYFDKQIEVIPDLSFYHEVFIRNKESEDIDKVIFVWDGQVGNFIYIETLIKNSQEFFSRDDVLLRVVTDKFDTRDGIEINDKLSGYGINYEFIEWNESTFIQYVASAHVGLAYIDQNCKHAMAKPDNKLVNYGGLGLLSIASNTRAYRDFSKKTKGKVLICNDKDQWDSSLKYCVDNKSIINELGAKNREFVLSNYTSDVLLDKWSQVLEQLEK